MMADEPAVPFEKLAPWATIPNVFADGVMSQSYGPGISKFYLYRTDGDPHAKGNPVNTPIAQVVMPAAGFVRTWAFFGKRIKTMIEQGFLTQDQVDELVKIATAEL
jgi:hypothetical protein